MMMLSPSQLVRPPGVDGWMDIWPDGTYHIQDRVLMLFYTAISRDAETNVWIHQRYSVRPFAGPAREASGGTMSALCLC